MTSNNILYSKQPYRPLPWVEDYIAPINIPKTRVNLGQFPTPIHPIKNLPFDTLNECEIWIKRDDMSSFDLSGNKIRKLEFLLADALDKGHDSTITIGGLQSNHARATAVASAQLGLESHIILRTQENIENIGITGNLLFNRLTGSKIYTVSPSTYAQLGSTELTSQLAHTLRVTQGKNPYVIPLGGSNSVGLYGYFECVDEILSVSAPPPPPCISIPMNNTSSTFPSSSSSSSSSSITFDHIIFACGSGGTAMGLSLGFKLYELYQHKLHSTTTTTARDDSSHSSSEKVHIYKRPQLHGINVCDSPEYFYQHMRDIAHTMNLDMTLLGDPTTWLHIYPGVGRGYARSTEEELAFIYDFAKSSGILLDPVYNGKAFYYFITHILPQTMKEGIIKSTDRLLFIHTGGTLGLYEKQDQLLPLLSKNDMMKMKVEKPKPII